MILSHPRRHTSHTILQSRQARHHPARVNGTLSQPRLPNDLTQLGPDETKVTLSYDWSAVGPIPRQHIQFPPFASDHLDISLSHLAAIVAR